MATAGMDGQVKVWDVRKFTPLHAYYTKKPATSMAISQTGLLAVSTGSVVSVWKDAFATKQDASYMTHRHPSAEIDQLQFCPYEDVLGYGHTKGIASIIIPGAGLANIDSLAANPYQTKKQRQEQEVHQLLEKIQPEMIQLVPNFVARVVTKDERSLRDREQRDEDIAALKTKTFTPKYRAKGKSSAMRRWLRKRQQNVITKEKLAVMEKLAEQKETREAKRKEQENPAVAQHVQGALGKFFEAAKKRPRVYA
jgi:U3 small nucleolar RNA-associated protein 7